MTDRGRPVAELVPISEPAAGGRLAQLVEAGLATPSNGSLLDHLRQAGGPTVGPAVSPRLEELRTDER